MSDGKKKVSIFKSPKEADCLRAVLYRCHNVNWPIYKGCRITSELINV
jgi:hypothetical protein